MSGITTSLGDGSSLTFEPVAPTHTRPQKRVLLTIDGKVHGDVLNCALIPVALIPNVIAALQLAASQVQP